MEKHHHIFCIEKMMLLVFDSSDHSMESVKHRYPQKYIPKLHENEVSDHRSGAVKNRRNWK